MSCKKYIEWLALYAIDELTPPDKAELEKHLGSCDACRVELEHLRATVKTLSYDTQKSLSEVEKSSIEREVYRKLSSRIHRRETSRRPIIRLVIQVAAALVIFVSGYGARAIINGDRSRDQAPATMEQIRQATDYHQMYASAMRFSEEGLTLIAKGKKSLSEVTVQGLKNK